MTMNGYFSESIRIISNSLESVDEDAFEHLVSDCVQTLKNGKKIVISGLGKNAPVCEKFVGTAWSFGLNALFIHTNTAMHGDLGAICDGDLVIMLSKSGETKESLLLAEHVKLRDVKDWSITFNSNSKLAKMTSETVSPTIESEGDLWNTSPNNSATVYLILLQALAIDLCKRMEVTLNQFQKNHPGGNIGDKVNGS